VGTTEQMRRAIRTVLVTARAAIHSNQRLGRADLAMESARRGLQLLDELEVRLPDDAEDEVRADFAAALDELESAADDGSPGLRIFSVGEDRAVPEDVDVRA